MVIFSFFVGKFYIVPSFQWLHRIDVVTFSTVTNRRRNYNETEKKGYLPKRCATYYWTNRSLWSDVPEKNKETFQ